MYGERTRGWRSSREERKNRKGGNKGEEERLRRGQHGGVNLGMQVHVHFKYSNLKLQNLRTNVDLKGFI